MLMPSQAQQVKIPVLPHVKSLIISLFGPEPVEAHENNFLGKEIQSILLSYSQSELFATRLHGETLTINISHRIAPYYQRFQHAFDLGCLFEKQFHSILYAHIEAQRQCGVPVLQAIKNFYIRYKINDELYDWEAAKKSYQRMQIKAS